MNPVVPIHHVLVTVRQARYARPVLDVEAFWVENRLCAGKPFRTDKPRAPLGLSVDDHWLLQEMCVPSTVRYFEDPDYQAETNRSCNDRCQSEIGIRPFSEIPPTARPLRIEQIFGARVVLTEGGTPWLEPGHETTESFAARLDELEHDDVLELAFSTGATIERSGGEYVAWTRGPITAGCSILGPERFVFWLVDEPDLMHRYFDTYAQVHIAYHSGLARLQGAKASGCAWLDDFCTLVSPKLHREFALPAMKTCMDAFPGWGFQHSDSAMEHLLPVLAELHYDGVNFGPTVPVREIRKHMPNAEICGQVPPFLLRDGTQEQVRENVVRDFHEVGLDGGMTITTAGSIAAGTTFEAMRNLMQIVQKYCRYDGRSTSHA